MRRSLLDCLCCPLTAEPLAVDAVHGRFTLGGEEHLVDAVLRNASGTFRYPVLDEIPRLVTPTELDDSERAVLAAVPPRRPATVEPAMVDEAALDAEIRRRVMTRWAIDDATDPVRRERAEREARYIARERRGENKRKYLPLVTPRVPAADSILELGGNFPGLAHILAEHYRPRRAVVANLAVTYPEAFKTPDRAIACVRADAQRLPFRDQSFDLVATAFMLEHVPDWRRALDHVLRVGRRAFVAFGPNAAFPYEMGHVDAPLAGSLPAPVDAWVAWAWLRLVGKPRPYARVVDILDHVYHVPSRTFRAQAARRGANPVNLFPGLVEGALTAGDDGGSRARRLLRRFPAAARLAARTMARLGVEPQMYYLLEGGATAGDAASSAPTLRYSGIASNSSQRA